MFDSFPLSVNVLTRNGDNHLVTPTNDFWSYTVDRQTRLPYE